MTTSPSSGASGGTELFYLDADGRKQDASLHAGMLDNPEADEAARRRAYENALDRGMSQEDADLLFGPMVTSPTIGHHEVGQYSDRIDTIQNQGKRERAIQALHTRDRDAVERLLQEKE